MGPTVATLSLGSPAVMRFRPKKKNAIGTPGNNAKGEKPAVVTIPLYHGDICIMHGVQLQKNYEVCTTLAVLATNTNDDFSTR